VKEKIHSNSKSKQDFIMDTKDINRYPIREYLARLNIHPVKDRGYYGMYHSLSGMTITPA
jgi:hypothetical protein